MRRLWLLPLCLTAACSEATVDRPPPLDVFYYPTGLALATRTGSTVPALLVASGDVDLRYGPNDGGTLLSVDPDASLAQPDGTLIQNGTGLRIGAYAGPIAVVSPDSCPGHTGPGHTGREALVASRSSRRLHLIPLADDGSLGRCGPGDCSIPLDSDLIDPFAVTLACRGATTANPVPRHSAFVAYLASPLVSGFPPGTAWISELDLDAPPGPLRTLALSSGPIGAMAYDAGTDRLYGVGRWDGQLAPLFVVDLQDCHPADPACPLPAFHAFDLYPLVRGTELRGIALSNPVAGQPRRAYVSAVLYDADLASTTGVRPGFDIGGVVMVLDLVEDASGVPGAHLVQVVDAGLGVGPIEVLPPRAGLRDLVVWTSAASGTVTVYDDERGVVARELAIDPHTGEPVVGRLPYALAVRDDGADALVYLAAFDTSQVAVLRVPLAAPGSASLAQQPIGKERR